MQTTSRHYTDITQTLHRHYTHNGISRKKRKWTIKKFSRKLNYLPSLIDQLAEERLICKDARFGLHLGQIGIKWDKSRAFIRSVFQMNINHILKSP